MNPANGLAPSDPPARYTGNRRAFAFALAVARAAGVLVVCGLTVGAGVARQALVETLDGRSFTGEAVLTNNRVVIDGTNVTALAGLRRLSFDVAPAAGGPGRGKGNGLLGFYFGRTNFQGGAVVRLDERVDFDWATGEPLQGVPPDRFSVIWSGDVEAPADGDYTFWLVADDTAQLLISSNLVAEAGFEKSGQERAGRSVSMKAGTRYPLLLKYQELGGSASVKLFWAGPGLTRRVIPSDRLYAKSRVPSHSSELLADEGLLATYYKNPDFSGESFTRVDPKIDFNWMDRDPAAGFSRSRYAVRWQGQFRVEHSETYTFHAVGDEPLRIWVEGRPLIMPGGQYYMMEVRESLPLVAGERYDIRVEAQSTSGNAAMKLLWSSPSTPKNVIPTTHLQPYSPVIGAGSPVARAGRHPRGLVLVNGSFVALPVERGNESVLRAGRWLKGHPVSTINVARIHCQPVSRAMIERIPAGRPGLLLAKGDFVDGEFRSLENGQVKIGSVLFGLKTYDANKDVLAVVLRDVRTRAAEFEVLLQDQSTITAGALELDAAGVRFRDPALGQCQLDASEVLEVRRPGRAPATAR